MEKQILRIGRISSINTDKGTARVTYEDRGGDTTAELPFLAWEYWMPKIADRVLVGHLSNGMAAGVIIGPVWNGNKRPSAPGPGRYHKEMSHDKDAFMDYQDSTETLIIRAKIVKIHVNENSILDLYAEIQDLKRRVSSLGG